MKNFFETFEYLRSAFTQIPIYYNLLMHIQLSALGKKMQGIICPTLITVQKHTTPENYYQILYYAARIQSSVKLYGSKGIYQK